MKIIKQEGRAIYVRHWFRWYYLDGFLVMQIDFKRARESLKED